MNTWKEKAIQVLNNSLHPVPTELNELDWKSGLSEKTERLAQHICAFANQKGGGLFVFGIHDSDGSCFDISKEETDKIIQTLGNIALNNLASPVQIEHEVMMYEGHSLLFVYVPEQMDKPVYLRGKDIYSAYHRSAGQTVKMSRDQVKAMIALTQGLTFEKQKAAIGLSTSEVLKKLNYTTLYRMIDKNVPTSSDSIIEKLKDYGFCEPNGDKWDITNLGALLFANHLSDFPNLNGHEVIVRKYIGTNNRQQEFEQHGVYGYAVGFEGLIEFIMRQTSSESIDIKRESIPTYPRIAIREFVANALVHQDFFIKGMPVTIEIFSNRLTITNAGAPLNDINRLIDLPPQSRNETLAQTMFLLGICERRGSGIDRAVEAVEKMNLPAVKFTKSDQHTRVFLFPQKSLKEMTKPEKTAACYQHACLMYEDGKSINNQSVRERFEIGKNDSSVASRIIADTVEAGFIKPADTETASKKYMTYIPYYG